MTTTMLTVQSVRDMLSQLKEPLRSLFDVEALRTLAAQADAPAAILDPATPIREANIGGTCCECVGDAASGPVLLYLHGGGFMFPPGNSYRWVLQQLARRIGVTACMPRYRLAPEFPFPAALDDCLAVYSALVSEGHRVIIAGDSAGGGLAVSLVLCARTRGLALPAALYLMSPFTDLACSGESMFGKAAVDPICSPEAVLHRAFHYLAGLSPTDPVASPFYGDLSGLPPTLIHVGNDEVMLDDSVRFAARALKLGSPVDCTVYDGMPHIFPTIPFVPECEAALNVGADFLKRHLSP
jgi:acetyl esterase/lipase